MSRMLHRFGKFYGRVMLRFMGIFIFIGILSVVCGDSGWMPNEDIYAISRFTYQALLPLLIAYTSGGQMRRAGLSEQEKKEQAKELRPGGVIAVMALAGVLSSGSNNGMLAAMVLGPVCGFLWENVMEPFTERWKTVAEMLVRSLAIAVTGCVMAIAAVYVIEPCFRVITGAVMLGINCLVTHNLICLVSVVIEPAKVFFLNNSINHGILVPLGLQQAEQEGSSILFLLESNPGPGLGVLLAAYWCNKDRSKRREYATGMFAECIGGLHEVYFPVVLANIRLLLAVIAGGTVGNLIFSVFGAQTLSAVTPGSICTVFLVTPGEAIPAVVAGILLSTLVSFAVASAILRMQNKKRLREQTDEKVLENEAGITGTDETEHEAVQTAIRKVGFICDAGLGSSAMGAALFRRKLAENGITQVEVVACARDQIAENLDLAICQRDFKELVLEELPKLEVHVVSSLLSQEEYAQIIAEIRRRNGEVG